VYAELARQLSALSSGLGRPRTAAKHRLVASSLVGSFSRLDFRQAGQRQGQTLTARSCVLVLVLVAAGNALACSCPPIASIAEEFRLSALVFSAVVESDATIRSERLVHVRVQEIFKGGVQRHEVIRQRPCAPELKIGSSYVVFAERSDWRLLNTECLPNIDGTGEGLVELGVGRPAPASMLVECLAVGVVGVVVLMLNWRRLRRLRCRV
jgi:hypothetical protein